MKKKISRFDTEQPKPKFPINGAITICYIRDPPKVKTKDGLMKCFWLEGKKISCTIIKNVHIKCTHTRYLPTLIHIDIYTYTWMASKIDKKLALIAADFLTLKNQNRSLLRCCAACYFYACALKRIHICDKNRTWNFQSTSCVSFVLKV